MLIFWGRKFQFIPLCKLQGKWAIESYKILKDFMTLSNPVKSTHFTVSAALVVMAPSNYNNDYLAHY